MTPQTRAERPPTALITGATDGIGLALAELYGQRDHRLILVGRRESPPENTLFVDDTYCRADLRDADAADRVQAFLEKKEVDQIDRLILNAGTGYWGSTAAQSEESIREVVAVNLCSSVALIHRCHPYLKRAKGRVVLVGSVVMALPCPDYTVYAATKAAVDGLGRSLRYELMPDVSVQVVHPGATCSGFHEKIGVDPKRIDWTRFPSTEDMARKLISAIDGLPGRRVFGFGERLVWMAGRKFPWAIDSILGRR
jgi:short-subunit dehydrogenase